VGVVEFPTRFGLNSQTAIDSVFIDTSTIEKYDLYPFRNGLSDYDAQLLILNKVQKRKRNVILTCHTPFMKQAFTKPYPSMECKCTTTKEIERIIKSLKTRNLYGYDDISTKVLKISGPVVRSPINYICNKMLFWGV